MTCERWKGAHRKQDGRPVHRRQYVYRLRWEEANKRELARDEILHHTCGNCWCINVAHLEVMQQSDHLREHGLPGDWGQANKTHCPQGHEYSEENTYTYVTKDGATERHCKICRKAAKDKYLAKQRASKGF